MRSITRVAALGLTLSLLAACETPTDFEADGFVSETTGSMERVDPGDPTSAWIGEEIVRIVDGDGKLVCEGDVDLDAIGAADRDRPPTFDLTLDVVRSPVKDLAENCSIAAEAAETATRSRYLAFDPSPKGDSIGTGRVLQADSPSGPWTVFAGGVFDGDRIGYRRTDFIVPHDFGDPSDFDPRDLPTWEE